MPDLRQLHELTSQIRTPELSRLADIAAHRRRRAGAALVAGFAAGLVIVLVIASGLLSERDTTSEPVGPGPSPTPSFPVLSAEQIRHHPEATTSSDDDFPATASTVAARIWSVCLGECTRATEPVAGELQTALEVSDDDFATGALYELDRSDWISHAVDDWYLIEQFDGPALVDSEGHRRSLRFGSSVSLAGTAGPLVYSRRGLAYVDMAAGALHPLRGRGSWDWQGAGDTWFWGTATLGRDVRFTRHAAVWRRPDGRFAAFVLPIGESNSTTGMLTAATPGTIAVVEHWSHPPRAHISTDYGRTWQVREVPPGVDFGGDLPTDWRSWRVSGGA